MRTKALVAVVATTALLVGCASTPRPYAPVLATAPADQVAFDRAAADCHQLMVAGKLDSNGRLASLGGAGAAVGVTAAAGAATTAAMAGYGAMAAAGATIILLPFALVGGAVGMSKAKRAKKERAIKQVMAGCLAEKGYAVTSWSRLTKAQAAKAAAEADARRAAAAATPST